MKTTGKWLCRLLPAVLLLGAMLFLGADKAEASQYYYFKEPASGANVTAGKKIYVSFYAGVTITTTHMDAWGNPSYVEYQEMPITFRVYKGSTKIYEKEYKYTEPTTLSIPYTPNATGTLKLRIYGRDRGLNNYDQNLQDEISIKVKKANAAAVKKIKPKIDVVRTGKKKAEISCTNSMGFTMKVYRATKKSGKYKLIKSTSKSTFIDKKIKPTKAYYYKVRLFAKKGRKTYKSKWSAVKKIGKYKKPSIPVVTLEDRGTKGVYIKWSCTADVDRYWVLRTDNPNDVGGESVADLPKTKTSCYDPCKYPAGTTMYYYVFGVKNPNSDHPTKYISKQAKIYIKKSQY